MITVTGAVLVDSFSIFRRCGAGRRECVSYWLGPLDSPRIVDEVVHPVHKAGRGGYAIDDGWLTAFWFDLARRSKSVRVQVHTHPGEAFHSATDDEWAVVHTPGFLSLVIPRFAQGPIGLEGAYLAERIATGWRPVEITTYLHPLATAGR